jgi:hypothetical protein
MDRLLKIFTRIRKAGKARRQASESPTAVDSKPLTRKEFLRTLAAGITQPYIRIIDIPPIDPGLAIFRFCCVYPESRMNRFGVIAGSRCNCYEGIRIWRLEP